MQTMKYYIAFNDFECKVVVNNLNKIQNSFISNGKYTNAVDKALLKFIKEKKKFKVIYKEHNCKISIFMTRKQIFATL